MKLPIFLFLILGLFAMPSAAQRAKVARGKSRKTTVSTCKLTEAPKLRGFYLGQTVDEIQKVIPGFREAYEFQRKDRETAFPLSDWRREIATTISREIDLVYLPSDGAFGIDSDRDLLTTADYEDVDVIWWFMKERLFAYGIYYKELEIDQDAEKFAKQVSAKTFLPQKGWRVISSGLEAEMLCDGFKVFLNAGYRNFPHLIFTDTKTETEILRLEKELKLRKKKEGQERLRLEREKRSTFRP
ncbi:MAG: hypothetical protein R2682_09440 [Pyrinomonadaceae bacterium]